MRRHFILFCFLISVFQGFSQVDHWESVVLEGDEWSYLVPNSQPDIAWKQLSFDESGWTAGLSGIGYGDGDDATVIGTTLSVYMRLSFEVVSLSEIDRVLLDMDFDDGFVAYLNGNEIARALVSGDVPGFDQPADGLHEAQLYQGIDPDRFEINSDILLEGTNLLAVEVHNDNINSSDLTSIPTLSFGINTNTSHYRQVPDWFDEPVYIPPSDFESSTLPIVVLQTENNQAIPNEPKIRAYMTIIDNGPDQANTLSDSVNAGSLDYKGNIQIELRGSSSLGASDKKQYALTTYDALWEKDNVRLLDLPSENDWILFAAAFDPSLMRDYLGYTLARSLGEYASRGKYCEVFLNGDYIGLYILQEKLKADDNRIDINKIDMDDLEGPQLTGGYITKSDKTEGDDVSSWSIGNSEYIHEHPNPTTVQPQQNEYIQDVFFSLASTTSQENSSVTDGYPSIIDLPSFIDFIIINELGSNADAYRYSTFFHKDRNAKLRAGPVWDLNLTFGNDLFFWGYDRSRTNVWQFEYDNVGSMFWRDLFYDPVFNCYLSKRWSEVTQPGAVLHVDQVHDLIDQTRLKIAESALRDYSRWGIELDHETHIDEMKLWVTDRITWMTNELGNGQGCQGENVPELVITKIHYHPSIALGDNSKNDYEFIEITNAGNESADLTGVYFGGTGLVYQFPSNTILGAGESLLLANESDAFRAVYGFLPFDEYSRSLSNGGQSITLLNAYGNLIDEVTYSDDTPWPTSADGEGFFLSVIDPGADNSDPANWQAVEQSAISTLSSGPVIEPMMTIFPNPAMNHVMIASKQGILSTRIRDLQGRILFQKEWYGEKMIKVNLLDYPKGLYFLETQTKGKLYTRKLLIK